MNTLETVCFKYDGSDDSKNIIRIMNKNHRSDFKGNDKYFYWIANNIADTFYKMDKDLTEIPPYDYLALLTGKQLTEGETLEIDWKEDFSYENGNYMNTCTFCGNDFKGHKRRVVCKLCSDKMKLLPTQESNSKVSWNRSIKDSESLNTTQESVKQDNAKEFLKNKKITRATCYTDNGNTFYLNDITVLMDEYSTQQTAHLQQQLNTLTSEIKRFQEKYDENGYDCSNEIKLLRIENHIDSTLSFYHKEVTDLQQQLKEAKELLEESFPIIQAAITLLRVAPNNNTLPEPPHDVIKLVKSINQFLTRNQ